MILISSPPARSETSLSLVRPGNTWTRSSTKRWRCRVRSWSGSPNSPSSLFGTTFGVVDEFGGGADAPHIPRHAGIPNLRPLRQIAVPRLWIEIAVFLVGHSVELGEE